MSNVARNEQHVEAMIDDLYNAYVAKKMEYAKKQGRILRYKEYDSREEFGRKIPR